MIIGLIQVLLASSRICGRPSYLQNWGQFGGRYWQRKATIDTMLFQRDFCLTTSKKTTSNTSPTKRQDKTSGLS